MVIGASLSEPHTSVTSLGMRVCIYAWTDHLPKILNKCIYSLSLQLTVHSILQRLSLCTWWVIVKGSIARVQCWLPGVETTEVEAYMTTYCLFATNHQWQLAHRQYNFDHDSG